MHPNEDGIILRHEYKVKWRDSSEDTWEPGDVIPSSLFEKFFDELREQQAKERCTTKDLKINHGLRKVPAEVNPVLRDHTGINANKIY